MAVNLVKLSGCRAEMERPHPRRVGPKGDLDVALCLLQLGAEQTEASDSQANHRHRFRSSRASASTTPSAITTAVGDGLGRGGRGDDEEGECENDGVGLHCVGVHLACCRDRVRCTIRARRAVAG